MKIINYITILSLTIMVFSCRNTIEVECKCTWVKLEEDETIAGYIRSGNLIYGGWVLNPLDSFPPLSNADIQTFEVCIGRSYASLDEFMTAERQRWSMTRLYARDKNRVYYPIMILCEDGIYHGGCFFEEYVVIGANPKTFKYLGEGYGIDGKRLFHRGVRVRYDRNTIKRLLEAQQCDEK